MSILISILLIVEVLSAFLLVVIILAQKSKDQGLGMAFGGGMGESLFGSRAGNVLTRMTITLASVFMLTTIVLGILFARGQGRGGGSVMDRADREVPAAPAAPATPGAPMAAPLQPAPMVEGEAPVPLPPMTEPAGPVTLQMGEGGDLAPIEAVAPAAPAAAPAVAESPVQAPTAPAQEPAAPAESEPAP